jgi:hypothetical protein
VTAWRTIAVLVLLAIVGGGAACARKKKPGAATIEGLAGGGEVFSDDFQRDKPGDRWTQRSGKWDVKDGWLHCAGDKNEGIWLNVPLPDRVRVEFDARSQSEDGDLKFEIFATDQRHQAGYIVIMGGWKNTVSIIARLNEHGEDRIEKDLSVEKGRTYRFAAVRTDGTLSWFVDGRLVAQYPDEDPIRGRYFGFNDWATDVYFDNLKVFRL